MPAFTKPAFARAVWRQILLVGLVAIILLAWWPWNFWLIIVLASRRLRRSYKDSATAAARPAANQQAELEKRQHFIEGYHVKRQHHAMGSN